jgi:hypothetical protein
MEFYSDIHAKPINAVCERNAELLIVKVDGTYKNHSALKGSDSVQFL